LTSFDAPREYRGIGISPATAADADALPTPLRNIQNSFLEQKFHNKRYRAVNMEESMTVAEAFTSMADVTARASGRPLVFAIVAVSTAVWLLTGPIFGFSDAWQLVADTTTNVLTFLMVFVIQNSQNRDGAAIQAKLDELIRATPSHPSLVGIEERTQEEIEQINAERKR
jgi:low affinity Fe/Cu permease